MGKRFLFVMCGIALVSLVGCATLQQMTQPTAQVDNYANATPLPPYSGPKARIAIADFDVKAAKATGEIGSGLREMLITALLNSNRFSIVERQSLGAVMQEQELAATQEGPGPQRGKIKTADLIISAAVTEFEPQSSGGVGGIGGGGSIGSGVLGGLLGVSYNKAIWPEPFGSSTLRLRDYRLTSVQGQASDIGGAIVEGFWQWALIAGLSAYAKTPMEKAIRICIIEE